MTAPGDLSPEREEQLIEDLLRERAKIDPGKVGPVVDLAALGLVNGAWRNTCVENWHAEGRLSDGDMLRVNSHTTWRVRQLMRRWMRETGLEAESQISALDTLAMENTWWLARRLYRWLVNPARRLPTGVTLLQFAGDGLLEYQGDAEDCLIAFGAQAENRGTRFGFARTAEHGGLACSHWWGHPHWPALVDRFMTALGNPADDHVAVDRGLQSDPCYAGRPAPAKGPNVLYCGLLGCHGCQGQLVSRNIDPSGMVLPILRSPWLAGGQRASGQ